MNPGINSKITQSLSIDQRRKKSRGYSYKQDQQNKMLTKKTGATLIQCIFFFFIAW